MAFQRGAGAEGNDRRLVLGAKPDDVGHLLRAVRERNGIGRARRVIGFVLAVLLQNGRRSRQASAEALAQGRQQLRVERDALQNGRGHLSPGMKSRRLANTPAGPSRATSYMGNFRRFTAQL